MNIQSLLYSEASNSFHIYDSSGEVDINQIRADVEHTSALLNSVGLDHYETVAIICENHSCFVTALLSIITVGLIALPIDPQISPASLSQLTQKFHIRSAFVFGKRAEDTVKLENPFLYVFHCDNKKWVGPSYNRTPVVTVQKNVLNYGVSNPAFLLLTSGTTSSIYKGVLLSHDTILNNIESIIDYMQPKRGESLYIAKSLTHVASLIGELLVALAAGLNLYLFTPVIPYSVLFKRLVLLQLDYLVVNPTLLYYLTDYVEKGTELPKIKSIYTSGGFASATLINRARKAFSSSKVYNMYGLTEAGPRVAAQTNTPDNYKAGFVGRPIKGVSVKIVTDSGEAPINQEGQIYVKTNALMMGYYEAPQLTNLKIRDGWLITGDIGYLNENGELYVSGRADDIVIRSGKNINLNMVEAVITEMDAIKECIVFSVTDPVYQNKIICAYVKNGEKVIDASEIRAYCLTKLFPYECPQTIMEWDGIPKTNTNKKSRKKACEYYLEHCI